MKHKKILLAIFMLFVFFTNAQVSTNYNNFDTISLEGRFKKNYKNEKGRMITGPITEKENNKEQIWGSAVYFALVQLNQTPPVNSGIAYAGWNRNSTPATSATGIHHPQGDEMKISIDNHSVTRASCGGSTNQHWQVTWDRGVTEPGSSGSPLFDQNHRIIGQLHGGPSSCTSSDLRDNYGSF